MEHSMNRMKKIPDNELEQRLELVKELRAEEHESYSIVKDRFTGEHYVHYAYAHMNVAAGTELESYHYLLPIETDDVLGILFAGQDYDYPNAWRQAYLRNGPLGFYVWFDPAGEEEASERLAADIRDRLLRFKQERTGTPEEVDRLMRELDELRKSDPDKAWDEPRRTDETGKNG